MKFNNKQSLTFFSLLTFCAIATSLETIPNNLLSKRQSFDPAIEQQLNSQESQNQIDRVGKGNDRVVEEIELDKEWKSIFGNNSEKEIILASGPTF